MEQPREPGVYLSVGELRVLFPRLKKYEALLSSPERLVLRKLEKTLYEYLSVQEMENLLSPHGEAGSP